MASASATGTAVVKLDARATVRRARRLKRAMMVSKRMFLRTDIEDWSEC